MPSSEIEVAEMSMTERENTTPGETEAEIKDYGTVPNKEENEQTADNDLVMMSSDNESDQELLIVSDEHTHKQTFTLAYIKRIMKIKACDYYHWFLILFKNGYWRTTLLLWYLW